MGNFKSPFKVGQVIKNEELVSKFKVGNSGGMRRSIENKTLVIICDHTKGLYDDKWYGNILHYTGMGKREIKIVNISRIKLFQNLILTE